MKCIVPVCKNSRQNNPSKMFIRVPLDAKQRQKWAKAINVKKLSHSGKYACCEDHFNLSEDSSNWIFYKMMGTCLKLKPTTVPTLYLTSPPTCELPPQYSLSERKQKYDALNVFKLDKLKPKVNKIIIEPDKTIKTPTEIVYTINLPTTLRYNNEVQSIIDCLEIEIEKLPNSLQHSMICSKINKGNTVKFFISCTPNDDTIYISNAFWGRCPNNVIVTKSGYLKKLSGNVQVLTDRGFKQFERMLHQNYQSQTTFTEPTTVSATLIEQEPTSVKANVRLKKKEARQAKRITIRIYIERVIRRIRESEMLHMHPEIV